MNPVINFEDGPDNENLTLQKIVARKYFNTKISRSTVLPHHFINMIIHVYTYKLPRWGRNLIMHAKQSKYIPKHNNYKNIPYVRWQLIEVHLDGTIVVGT